MRLRMIAEETDQEPTEAMLSNFEKRTKKHIGLVAKSPEAAPNDRLGR